MFNRYKKNERIYQFICMKKIFSTGGLDFFRNSSKVYFFESSGHTSKPLDLTLLRIFFFRENKSFCNANCENEGNYKSNWEWLRSIFWLYVSFFINFRPPFHLCWLTMGPLSYFHSDSKSFSSFIYEKRNYL